MQQQTLEKYVSHHIMHIKILAKWVLRLSHCRVINNNFMHDLINYGIDNTNAIYVNVCYLYM